MTTRAGSFDDAYAVAEPADYIVVADGSYGAQEITPVLGRTGPRVTIVPAVGATPSISQLVISGSHVALDGPFDAPDISVEGASDVALDGIDGDSLWIADAHDVDVAGGDFGSIAFSSDPMSSDIAFDGIDVHGTGTETTSCVYAADVQGLTIRNSLFRNCGESDLFITHFLVRPAADRRAAREQRVRGAGRTRRPSS